MAASGTGAARKKVALAEAMQGQSRSWTWSWVPRGGAALGCHEPKGQEGAWCRSEGVVPAESKGFNDL